MKKTVKAIVLILAMLVLASCGPRAEVQADDAGDYVLATQPSSNTQAEIDEVNEKFEKALLTKNSEGLKDIIDEQANVTVEQLNEFFNTVTAEGENPYTLYDSYYLNGLPVGEVAIRAKKSAEDGNFIMITPGSKEMYAAVYVSENKDLSRAVMMICAKMQGKWKIVWTDVTDMSYYGKDSREYYKLSKEAKDKGEDFLAYLYVQMMYNTIRPANLIHYKESEQMEEHAMELSDWGKDKFPIELSGGERKIHMLGLALDGSRVIPMILVQTDADLKNADTFKADAKKVVGAFLEKYPYFKGTFSHITVNSTNADPSTAETQYDYESTVIEFK